MKTYFEARNGPCPKCEFEGVRGVTYREELRYDGFGDVPDITELECMLWTCPFCKAVERSEPLRRENKLDKSE